MSVFRCKSALKLNKKQQNLDIGLKLGKSVFLNNHIHKLVELLGNHARFKQFLVFLKLDFSTQNSKNKKVFIDPGSLDTSASEREL